MSFVAGLAAPTAATAAPAAAGPGWGSLVAPIIGGLGGFFGSGDDKERGPIPLDRNREGFSNYLQARDTFLYGPTDNWRGSGNMVHPNAEGGGGGFTDLYTNPANWPKYGPAPYGPMSPYTQAGIDQLGFAGSETLPGMADFYGNAVMTGMTPGGSAQDPFLQQFAQMSPQFQAEMAKGAPQSEYGGINTGQYTPTQQDIYGEQGLAALNNQLSGDADYRGFNEAMDAYYGDAMEQFNEQLLPAMQSADYMSQGGQSSAGALKAAQRTQEQIGEGMGRYGMSLLKDMNQAGLNRQGQAVGQVGSTGMGRYGLGQNTGIADAGFALDSSKFNANSEANLRDQYLRSMGLGVDSAGQTDMSQFRWGTQMPSAMDAQWDPAKANILAGNTEQSFTDRDALYASNLYNYDQNLPFTMGNDYLRMLSGTQSGPLPASTGGEGSGSPWLQAAAAGAALWPDNGNGQAFNPFTLFS